MRCARWYLVPSYIKSPTMFFSRLLGVNMSLLPLCCVYAIFFAPVELMLIVEPVAIGPLVGFNIQQAPATNSKLTPLVSISVFIYKSTNPFRSIVYYHRRFRCEYSTSVPIITGSRCRINGNK